MTGETPRDISEILASNPDVVQEGIREGVQEAIRRHKQMGLPMAVWRDGAVAWIPAEELEKEAEGARQADAAPRT